MLHNFLLAFTAFFAIMNPISSLPVYLGLTSSFNDNNARFVAKKSLSIAFVIVSICCVAGKFIFEMFGITLFALQIGGGIIVCIIGYHMLNNNKPPMKHNNNPSPDDLNVAISPLGTPLLAGPGTIATAINLSTKSGIYSIITTILSFGVLVIITYILFIYGKKIIRIVGENVMNVITRLMGLILVIIGTQMAIDGLKGAFVILR